MRWERLQAVTATGCTIWSSCFEEKAYKQAIKVCSTPELLGVVGQPCTVVAPNAQTLKEDLLVPIIQLPRRLQLYPWKLLQGSFVQRCFHTSRLWVFT